MAGPLTNMFNFGAGGGASKALILDPGTGLPAAPTTGPGGTPVPVTATTEVANPKGGATIAKQFNLDATASMSFDGKPLTYQWSLAAGSPGATIIAATTAAPTIQFDGGFGTYTFTLTVTDSAGKTATDTASVQYLGR